MPQLGKQDAEAVEATEVRDLTPLPPGLYPGRLRSVKTAEGPAGPYWTWEYEIPDGFENAGRRFWNTTSLSEKAKFKMKETFQAFGVPATTDTDELVGCGVLLRVGIRTIQSGDRAGESANTVNEVLPWDETKLMGLGAVTEDPLGV